MNRDINRERTFSRRALLLGAGKGALIAGLAARLYYLQVAQSEKFKLLSEGNRMSLRLIPPPRGEIADRNGVLLAVNKENYRIILVPEQTQSLEDTLNRLEVVIGLTARERRKIQRSVKRKRSFIPITVRENLSWDEVARLEVNSINLPGVQIEVGRSRFYPYGKITAHTIGYVGAVSGDELNGDAMLQLPDYRIGKTGIEKKFDEVLRGEAGTRQVEVNAVGRVIRELSRDEGVPGANFDLSIDIDLQDYIYKRLGTQAASVAVMDVHNGQVYGLVSTPSFDPNKFNFGISVNDWEALRSNPKLPLTNRVIAGQYAPASTFKLLVALAALEDGIRPSTTVTCSGYIDFGDSRFHCWKKKGHGKVDMLQAIAQSCDVYFYELGKQLGIEKIAAMARRFGLGKPVGIDIPGESPGLVPDSRWKRGAMGTRWQQGETLIAAIGQGYLLATPIQLATMVAQLANGGVKVSPKIFVDNPEEEEDPHPSLGVSRYALSTVRKGMEMATNEPKGTSFYSRIRKKSFRMAGKTGTAQVRRISAAERESGIVKNKNRPWRFRDHALYVGYAPLDKPRYAIAVVIEHGGGGSSAAAPVARDVLQKVQENFGDV